MINFRELGRISEVPKIPPGETLLIAEPIFHQPQDDTFPYITTFQIPKGQEGWAFAAYESGLTEESVADKLRQEYADIASALIDHNIPFRFIRAHKEEIDEELCFKLMFRFGVSGVNLHHLISSTCFPRDMLVHLDTITFVNPDANFFLPELRSRMSYLGEGGAVLRVNSKLFFSDPRGCDLKKHKKHSEHIKQLPARFNVGLLPFPCGVEINMLTGYSEEFLNHHVDRTAAFIKGRDGKDYLLVEPVYISENQQPWGSYAKFIQDQCTKLGVELVVIERAPDDTPYSLNLVQFYDGTVMMTAGHESLEKIIRQIVGDNRVITTQRPLVYYPVIRRGGWRCMSVFAPEGIAKPNSAFDALVRQMGLRK
ncbi:MAG: hypothetical protein G01um10145_271 [Microgenomates group bacterium Gr01-1014_5]|nr:MAG: hypothetical protein G01um10145_271 [Microgenomates group bacterium Gr01-1014_5]